MSSEESFCLGPVPPRKLGAGMVELLNLPEPPLFAAHSDPASWLLAVTSVHPLRYDYALKALQKLTSEPQELVGKLVEEELLSKVTYKGEVFLLRAFRGRQGTG